MHLRDYFHPIEFMETDDKWKNVEINECHEKLVSLNDISPQLMVSEEYYKKEIPGAIKGCYVRETVASLLLEASKKLPDGCSFIIFDAWRPPEVQKYLFDQYVNKLKNDFISLKEKDIIEMAEQYVSLPSINPDRPSPHFTGGAVDLTIIDDKGKYLFMDTEFDSFCQQSHTRYYEKKIEEGIKLSLTEINWCLNRRLLYNIMASVGFSNFSHEWWHYDFGNQPWGYYQRKKARYGLSSFN